MFCTECGTENRNDRKFCTNCGSPLKDYTKPRENLLMPEDITKAQEKVKTKNKLNKIFNIVIILTLLLAIASTVIIFCVGKPIKTIFIVTSIALFVLTIILIITKTIKTKKTNNKTK